MQLASGRRGVKGTPRRAVLPLVLRSCRWLGRPGAGRLLRSRMAPPGPPPFRLGCRPGMEAGAAEDGGRAGMSGPGHGRHSRGPQPPLLVHPHLRRLVRRHLPRPGPPGQRRQCPAPSRAEAPRPRRGGGDQHPRPRVGHRGAQDVRLPSPGLLRRQPAHEELPRALSHPRLAGDLGRLAARRLRGPHHGRAPAQGGHRPVHRGPSRCQRRLLPRRGVRGRPPRAQGPDLPRDRRGGLHRRSLPHRRGPHGPRHRRSVHRGLLRPEPHLPPPGRLLCRRVPLRVRQARQELLYRGPLRRRQGPRTGQHAQLLPSQHPAAASHRGVPRRRPGRWRLATRQRTHLQDAGRPGRGRHHEHRPG